MGGLVKGAQGLAGALERAWQLAKGLDNVEDLSKLGQVFREASERQPGYFVTNKELPTGLSATDSAEFLNRKFANPQTGFTPDLKTGASAVWGDKDRAKMSLEGTLGSHAANPAVASLLKRGRGGVGLGTDVYDIDTLALGTNAAGKQLYPAFWEYVLSRPDAMNIPTALSASNAFRRSVNMAPLYEKYGERANRVVIDPEQLLDGYAADGRQMAKFHGLPVDAQIGALNAAVAQGAGSEVQRIGDRLTRQARDGEGALGRYLDEAKALGIDPGAPWQPSTDVDPSYFPRLTKWLRDSAGAVGTNVRVGDSSLRRAAITSDALQGLRAGNLDGQSYLTQRLGRRQGGRVPPPRA